MNLGGPSPRVCSISDPPLPSLSSSGTAITLPPPAVKAASALAPVGNAAFDNSFVIVYCLGEGDEEEVGVGRGGTGMVVAIAMSTNSSSLVVCLLTRARSLRLSLLVQENGDTVKACSEVK